MKCKKCGCDALIKTDDWYKCPNCGAMIFDTDITVNDVTSPTKEMEKMENNSYSPVQEREPEAAGHSVNTALEEEPKKDKKKGSKKEEAQKSKSQEAIEFFVPIVIAVVVALLLKTFVFANAIVPTGSMLNTIQEGDRIIASRLAYINEDPRRYDIVIFKFPDDESQYYVKRVVGLPGETVQVINGVVYVTKTDGETIQLDDSFVTACEPEGTFGPYVVPKDCYFMMGDNRNNSLDSRFWKNKFVRKDKIEGKVKFRYFPNPATIE